MVWDFIKSFRHYFRWEENENNGDMEESSGDDLVNGFTLCGRLVPVEILSSILKWVDEDTLVFSCRLVCKQWMEITDDLVWEEKTNCTRMLIGPRSPQQIPWWVAYWVLKKSLFRGNLIKNGCGELQKQHWNIRDDNGDGWDVENEPQGSFEPLPQSEELGNRRSCFVTSFHWCSKEQVIKLREVGLSNKIMDTLQPDFDCSDWIGSRFDCGGMYGLKVSLLDKKGKQINAVTVERRLESGDPWVKINLKLEGPYPPGARYLSFFHKGKDTQFWKGHYGIKITGSTVKAIFPKERFLQEEEVTASIENIRSSVTINKTESINKLKPSK